MSTSLPRLRAISQSKQLQSQKGLKFKKIKLGTQGSIASLKSLHSKRNQVNAQLNNNYNLKQNKNSEPVIKSQRISSMDRYSTIHDYTDKRNQKSYLNLLERKLLTGRYDQTDQTGKQLNAIKVKTDQYRNQSIKNQQQTQKLKRQLAEIKKESSVILGQRKRLEDLLENVRIKFQNQKKKVDFAKSDKTVYQHMVKTRQDIHVNLQGQVTQARHYLQKLKSFEKIFEKQSKQTIERCKNTESAFQKIKNKIDQEHQTRQLQLLQQQSKIQKRTLSQASRQIRNKSLEEIKQRVQKQEYDDIFYQSYNRILSERFLHKFMINQHQRLLEKYNHMEDQYEKICSFSRVNQKDPQKMSQRFKEHSPQAAQLQKIIKEKEEIVSVLQHKKKNLEDKYTAAVAAGLQTHQQSAMQLIVKALNKNYNVKQADKKIHMQIIDNLQQKHKIEHIKKWIQRNMQVLSVKGQKSQGKQATARNLTKIIQKLKQGFQQVQKKKKEQAQKAEKGMLESKQQSQYNMQSSIAY